MKIGEILNQLSPRPHPHPTTDAAAAAAACDAKQIGVTPKPQCSFFSAC